MCSVSVRVLLVTCSAVSRLSYVFLMCLLYSFHHVYNSYCISKYSVCRVQVFRMASILYGKYSVSIASIPYGKYSVWQVFRLASIPYGKYSVSIASILNGKFCIAECRVGDNAWVASGFTEVMAAGFRRD